MTINLLLIAEWAGAITVIGGVCGWFLRKINRTLIEPIKRNGIDIQNLAGQESRLESWTRKQQEDIEENRECSRMLILASRACLDGLMQQGCNGKVTKAAHELDMYIMERLSDTKSKLNCGGVNDGKV